MSGDYLWLIVGALRDPWLIVGLLGQMFFFMRFLIQWIVSERRRESVIPIYFWYFSIGGGLILFIYATHKKDPVFMLGQGAGLLVYARNLYLIWKKQQRHQQAA
ncbi:MAG TPA: lipid-A-disaccharide synthase N-terminal domain-containing protein [Methylomirabilota bacterium]|nr:lipid-A-disaccharide synthase N-terminal domain-containing protein [Methylomirabilota bacterium]